MKKMHYTFFLTIYLYIKSRDVKIFCFHHSIFSPFFPPIVLVLKQANIVYC